MFAVALMGAVACSPEDLLFGPEKHVEEFEKTINGEYSFGYENEHMKFEYFYNEEYAYWGGFMQSLYTAYWLAKVPFAALSSTTHDCIKPPQ